MDKAFAYFEELGPVGGAGILLLIASWGLAIADLTDLKFTGLTKLPPAQIIACFGALIGLLLILYRVKKASAVETAAIDLGEADMAEWQKLVSFLKDRRALRSLMGFENLAYLMESIDSLRSYLGERLQALPPESGVRPALEDMQEACRTFADTWDRIQQTLAPENGVAVQTIVDVQPLVNQIWVCTTVGILRGQIAAILQHRSPEGIGGQHALIYGMVGNPA